MKVDKLSTNFLRIAQQYELLIFNLSIKKSSNTFLYKTNKWNTIKFFLIIQSLVKTKKTSKIRQFKKLFTNMIACYI